MEIKKYRKLREELIDDAFEVSNKKGQDYTQKSEDALKNFKEVAKRTGLTPKQVLGVYMMKHQDAIASYIEHDGQLESEPIKERIIDNINYLCLLWGLIQEDNDPFSEEDKQEIREQWNKIHSATNWEFEDNPEVVDPVKENGNRVTEEEAATFAGSKKLRTNFGTLLVHTGNE